MSRALLAPAATAARAALSRLPVAVTEAHLPELRFSPNAAAVARWVAALQYVGCWVTLFLLAHARPKSWADLRDDPVKLLLCWLYVTLLQLCVAACAAPSEAGPALAAALRSPGDAASVVAASALSAVAGVTTLAQAVMAPPAAFAALPPAHIGVALALDALSRLAAGRPLPPRRQLAACAAACVVTAAAAAADARHGSALAGVGAASAAASFLVARLDAAHGPRAAALATHAGSALLTLAALLGAFFFKETHWHWVSERRNWIVWSTSNLVFFILASCQGLAGTVVLHAFGPLATSLLSGIVAFLFAIGIAIAVAQPLPLAAQLAGIAAVAAFAAFQREAAMHEAGGAEGGQSLRKPHEEGDMPLPHAAAVAATDSGPPWLRLAMRVRACAAIVVVSIALPCVLRKHVRAIPAPLQLATWTAKGDSARPHEACGAPPALNTMAPRFTTCPVNPPFFAFEEPPNEASLAVLRSNCSSAHGGVGTYILSPVLESSIAQRVWPTRRPGAKRLPFPESGRVPLPRDVLTVRVTCRLRAGRGAIWDEFALVPSNLWAQAEERWVANGKLAPPAPVPDSRPSAMVILMDALSRSLANAALLDLMRLFREQRLRSVTAFEFDHFSIVGVRSNDNWPGIFCAGTDCSDPESNVFEHAARARMATAGLNNFCRQRPLVKSPRSNYSMESFVNEGFVCIRGTGMTESCAHGESVSRSFIDITSYVVRKAHAAGRRFMTLVAPHEAHMTPHGKLVAAQPRVIGMLHELDASGALDNAVVFFLADHGLHYDNEMDTYAPAAAAHRNPVLFVLVGNALLAKLPPGAMGTMLRNRGRLIVMHDIFATLAAVVGAPRARTVPGSVDLLREEVPPGRSCDDAHVKDYCNCFGDTQHRFDEYEANR